MRPHVLAVRQDNVGDVLLAGPAVRALAAGAARVTMLCGPRGAAAARLLPSVDDVVVRVAPWIDPEPPPVDLAEHMAFVELLRGLALDAAVVFTSFHQSPLPALHELRLAGVGFLAAISEDYPGSLLDVRHRVGPGLHEVERALSLADAAGFPLPDGDDARLQVVPPGAAPQRFDVVVHPGSTAPARTWHATAWRDAVVELVRSGRTVAVTGAPAEAELTRFVAGHAATDLGGRTDLGALAAVMGGAGVVVTGNTGPAHLAAAVATPVVSLFAPTVPWTGWRPWGVPSRVLGDQSVECAGCRARTCPLQDHRGVAPCLGAVDPLDVVAAVTEIEREAVAV